jgi:tetratricopeptide (TPR) repeat protein
MIFFKALYFTLLIALSPAVVGQSSVWSRHMDTGLAFSSQKDFEAAIIEFLIALDIAEKRFPDSLRLGRTHAHLAGAYRSNLDYSEAERHFLIAKSSFDRLLGDEHIEAGYVMGRLGNMYLDMGEVQQGVQFNEKALMIAENHFESKNHNVGMARLNVGYAYYKQERYIEAVVMIEQSLLSLESKFGENHPT